MSVSGRQSNICGRPMSLGARIVGIKVRMRHCPGAVRSSQIATSVRQRFCGASIRTAVRNLWLVAALANVYRIARCPIEADTPKAYAVSGPASRLAWARSRSFTADRSLGQRSEEHTSELQSRGHLVCRLL